VEFLKSQKTQRLGALLRDRFSTVQSVIEKLGQGVTPEPLPHAADLCTVKEIQELLFDPSNASMSKNQLELRLFAVLPAIISLWRKEITTKLTTRFLWHFGAIDADILPLQLAVAVFKCSRCPDTFCSSPAVLAHARECVSTQLTDDGLPNQDDHYEFFAASTFQRLPWSCTVLEMDPWIHRARAVIEACGYNPSRATAVQMDLFDPRLTCALCPGVVMNWRTAVCLCPLV
jgi:hypothetical protein